MFDIIRSKVESDRITDFVAIGNYIDPIHSTHHAAFVIQYNGHLYEFHYSGRAVEFKSIETDYYHKITDTILAAEIPAFIALCKHIEKKARPTYGFFISGDMYDKDGNYICNSPLGEVMTCVGFCLSVLKGFHEEDYLVYSDWDESTHEVEDYVINYCLKHNLDPDKVAPFHRRITPRECLTSCYFSQLPISKEMIDRKIEEVNQYFESVLN